MKEIDPYVPLVRARSAWGWRSNSPLYERIARGEIEPPIKIGHRSYYRQSYVNFRLDLIEAQSRAAQSHGAQASPASKS